MVERRYSASRFTLDEVKRLCRLDIHMIPIVISQTDDEEMAWRLVHMLTQASAVSKILDTQPETFP